jgi:hypothetical protein
MKISPYIIYVEMQPNALLLRQNFIIRKKWVLQAFCILTMVCCMVQSIYACMASSCSRVGNGGGDALAASLFSALAFLVLAI